MSSVVCFNFFGGKNVGSIEFAVTRDFQCLAILSGFATTASALASHLARIVQSILTSINGATHNCSGCP